MRMQCTQKVVTQFLHSKGKIPYKSKLTEMQLVNPAQNLTGLTILDEWIVENPINLRENGSTGGHFCIPYEVRSIKSGQRAFLKVLDVVKAIQRYGNDGIGVAETLSRITNSHLFESQLMAACQAKRLNRVVRALAFGEISLELPPLGQIGFPYLIFELADGDTHKVLQIAGKLDLAWWFTTLHQAAVGVQQLHGIDIAHQDLKPSNVVFFGVDNAKLADLGRAARKGVGSPNDNRAGDICYAPPEYYYAYSSNDWSERFLAMDLYLLGNLAFTGVTGLSITTALFNCLPSAFLPANHRGNYGEALPALIHALAETLQLVRQDVPESIRDLFLSTIEQLCHPDPSMRGHPKNHRMIAGNRFSVERFVSAFYRMAVLAKQQIAQ